jgi:mRNA interferase YafQ
MIFKISFGTKFKRDFKIIKRRGYPIELLIEVFELLEKNGTLPGKYFPHKLTGNYADCWECHIKPDWLLVWECNEKLKEIRFVRTGTHADLF